MFLNGGDDAEILMAASLKPVKLTASVAFLWFLKNICMLDVRV